MDLFSIFGLKTHQNQILLRLELRTLSLDLVFSQISTFLEDSVVIFTKIYWLKAVESSRNIEMCQKQYQLFKSYCELSALFSKHNYPFVITYIPCIMFSNNMLNFLKFYNMLVPEAKDLYKATHSSQIRDLRST